MIWAQGGICFLAWLAYGVAMRRRSERLRTSLRTLSRPRMVLLSSACFVGSIVGLLAGLYLLSSWGGIEQGILVWWAWVAVAAIGIGFVHLQVLGAAALVTMVQQDETDKARIASERQELQRSSQEQ